MASVGLLCFLAPFCKKPASVEASCHVVSDTGSSSPEKAHKHKEVTPKLGPETPPPHLETPPLKILYAAICTVFLLGKMTAA